MSLGQLAFNVSVLDAAIVFYCKLFATEPAKVPPGYANFAITEPPLKLVLIEHESSSRGDGVLGALKHLGIEVETTEEVGSATRRLADDGLATELEEQTTCCSALQDKVWVHDPDRAPWEGYAVLADAPIESGITGDGRCCEASSTEATDDSHEASRTAASCC